ncbi:alpha/beta hydrolase fold [Amycolatopsis xylanica]|uniref:Alpha/beta hydrolase fold n=1 Tax=Amycolatopsis xylanica TaxID=589385 RepID=A0A1H2U5J0_9PSEU|nr:alpha/beta hydrolase [Amycolatopsis xylanica]SDW51446.1 alpha/beta hydrolase fold [Amycolatopsis xylanica]
MGKVPAIALAVVVLGAGALAGVPAAASAGGVRWGPCPADAAAPGLECSTIQVPLDYRAPEGKRIDVAISRLASKAPGQRRGVLLTNPGGPSPGLKFPADLAAAKLPQSVLDGYDVIGFDPRGLGHSTPMTCDLTPEQQAVGNVPPYARDAADVAKRAEQSKAIARQCAASKTSWLLPHVNAANTARDMDRIRAALGEEKISFAGYSWGTYLGAVYATLFPQRGDRIVLDSNVHPGGWDYANDRYFAQGFEDRFPDFAKFAAANDGTYHLGATPEQVTAKYFDLAGRLDKKPVREIDGAAFRMLTFGFLYNDAGMPLVAKIWRAVDTDQPLPPLGPGTPGDVDSLISGRYAMICADARWPKSVGSYQAAVALDRLRHPMFGAAGANVQPCAFWEVTAEPPVRIGDRGPSNILMLQNRRDPATPLAGAARLRQAFGDRARMVTVDAGGHGVYPYVGNKCANAAATAFLTTGRFLERDLACAAEPS